MYFGSVLSSVLVDDSWLLELGEIIFYFMIYGFFGWMLENSYNYFVNGIFLKDNFWKGPFKPMYGFAPILLVSMIGEGGPLYLILLLCFFVPTLVEYISGLILDTLFQRKWWDYKGMPMQFQGHICLPFSLCWFVLSLFCVTYLHPGLERVFLLVTSWWSYVWPMVMVYFITEVLFAVMRHMRGRYAEKGTGSLH